VGYGTWVANSACTKMVGIEIAAADWFPLSDWRKFDAMFHKKPLCRLFSIDLASGQRRVILEQQGWLGHPQYRPFDDHTVAYCHEGPHDLIDARMWFINEDGTNRRCAKEHRERRELHARVLGAGWLGHDLRELPQGRGASAGSVRWTR
jgi:oligogalacturonide lyase